MLNLIFGTIWYAIRDHADDVGGVQSLVAAIFFTAAFCAMVSEAQAPVVFALIATGLRLRVRPNNGKRSAVA